MAEGTNVGSIFLDLVVRDTVEKQVQDMAAKGQAVTQKAFSGMEKAAETSVNNAVAQTGKMIDKVMRVGETLANGPARFAEKALSKIGMASKAAADDMARTAGNAGRSVEQTVADSFDKSVSLAQARVRELEREYERISDKLTEVKWSYSYNEDGDKTTDRLVERLTAQREAMYDRLLSARERLAIQTQAAAQRESAAENKAAQKATAVTQREANHRKAIHESMWKNMLATAGNASSAISRKAAGITGGFNKAGRAANYLGTRFRGIVSSALIFNGVSALLRNVTSYFWETVSSTDALKNALANLKGAAATAAAPIIETLTPALVKLTNAAATAFSYVAKLISAITGKSISDMAKLAKNAADTARKVKGSLAGFDEIEKAGGSNNTDQQYNYEFQGQSTFLDHVLQSLQGNKWEQAGKLFAEKLNSFVTTAFNGITHQIQSINWGSIGDRIASFLTNIDLAGITRSFANAVGAAIGGLGALIWGLIEDGWNSMFSNFVKYTEMCGGNAIAGLLAGILLGLADIAVWIWDNVFVPIWDGIRSAFEIHSPSKKMAEIGEYIIAGMLNGLSTAWTSIPAFFENSFAKLKATIVSFWAEGIVPAIKGPINSTISCINAMVSGIVTGINAAIEVLNKLSFHVPDWIPGIGGETFGFNIKTIAAPQIPMLENGGVITQPTLAMMGEYPGAHSNPEIVAPQSILEETMANVMRELVEQNRQSLETAIEILRDILEAVLGIQLTDEMIGRAVARYNSKMAIIRGGNT